QAIAGAFAFELAMAFLFSLGFLKGGQLGLRQKNAILRNLGFERFFVLPRSWRCQTERTPKGEMESPRFLSSFETRTCPQLGWSMANSTTAFSISGATRLAMPAHLGQRQIAAFVVTLL